MSSPDSGGGWRAPVHGTPAGRLPNWRQPIHLGVAILLQFYLHGVVLRASQRAAVRLAGISAQAAAAAAGAATAATIRGGGRGSVGAG